MKFYNGFGITPTKNFTAAGWDFYVPNIDELPEEKINKFLSEDGIQKSYNISKEQIDNLLLEIDNYKNKEDSEISKLINNNKYNILHLFLALNSNTPISNRNISNFIYEYGMFDKNGHFGISMNLNDTIFINSGIKEALDKNTAGIFFNKSGKGNKGFDVRACVVDEDYSGYVHLSLAYTLSSNNGIIYVGDKLIQQCILYIVDTSDTSEVSEDEYIELMKNSKRGSKAFGSSDVKH